MRVVFLLYLLDSLTKHTCGMYYVALLQSYTLQSKLSLVSKKKGKELTSKINQNNESNTQK